MWIFNNAPCRTSWSYCCCTALHSPCPRWTKDTFSLHSPSLSSFGPNWNSWRCYLDSCQKCLDVLPSPNFSNTSGCFPDSKLQPWHSWYLKSRSLLWEHTKLLKLFRGSCWENRLLIERVSPFTNCALWKCTPKTKCLLILTYLSSVAQNLFDSCTLVYAGTGVCYICTKNQKKKFTLYVVYFI